MQEKCCSYLNPHDQNRCGLPTWKQSPQGYCIGHARELEKPKALLAKIIQTKIKKNDYRFDGFLFPFRLTLKNAVIDAEVSFSDCTFLKGLHFRNISFQGPIHSFARTFFWGGSFVFEQCRFQGQETLFSSSLFEGNLVLFQDCAFESESTRFDELQWNAENMIAFHNCRYSGKQVSLFGSNLRAAKIVWLQNDIAPDEFRVNHTEWNSTLLAFRKNKFGGGPCVFQEARLNASDTLFTENHWSSRSTLFSKCVWKGARFEFGAGSHIKTPFQFERCQWEGGQISFHDLYSHADSLIFKENRFNAKNKIDFSLLHSTQKIQWIENSFQAHEFLGKNIQVEGEAFLFQKNKIHARQIDFSESSFETKQVSFNRSSFQANKVDFSQCRFQNAHTSFQAIKAKGGTFTIADSRFLSRRVSFNLSSLEMNDVLFDRIYLGFASLSFWKTRFGSSNVYLRGITDSDAKIYLPDEAANLFFRDSNISECIIDRTHWPRTGLFQRRSIADEEALLESHNYEELKRLYGWLAVQYARGGNKKMHTDFLFSIREVERIERLHNKQYGQALLMECSRWTAGYGLGFSKIGLIKGSLSLLTSLFLILDRFR